MPASKAIRSLFSWRTVDDAAVGGFKKMCHQFADRLVEGVAGSEARMVGKEASGPVIVFVNMWIIPHRMSTCKVKRAVMPRWRSDCRVVSNAEAVTEVRGKNTS